MLSVPQSLQAQQTTLFTKVMLFDGQALSGPTKVLIEKGKVSQIGRTASAPAEANVIDGSGMTLLPGMIDSHNHAFFAGHLQDAALFGVTTELDMMSVPQMVRGFRQQQAAGQANNRADIFSAGAAVTVAGGHGTQFGFPVPTLDQASNAAEFVAARKAEGSDFIKIIYEDGSAYGFSRPTLSEEMVAAAIKAAHELDLLAVAHVSTHAGAELVVKHGIDGLVHLFCDKRVENDLLEAMKRRNVFVVPTACVVSNASGQNLTSMVVEDSELRPLLDREALGNLSRTFPQRDGLTSSVEILNHNIKTMHDSGVRILAGTDALNPGTSHGVSMHHEVRLLTKAGLTSIEALRACTSLPAECFGLNDRGSISIGKRADLILVAGSPQDNVQDLAKIVGIWKAGHRLDRQSKIDQVAASNATQPSNAGGTGKLISNFDGKEIDSQFGTGWANSTDSIMGGTSTVSMKLTKSGAEQSEGALSIQGKTRESQPAFSGVMFSPGDSPMQPKDLSTNKKLTFWSKGDGTSFQVMLFFQKRGFNPSMQSFTAGSKWTKHSFELSSFDECDGTDIIGIWFGSGMPGEFEFQIDQVQLEK